MQTTCLVMTVFKKNPAEWTYLLIGAASNGRLRFLDCVGTSIQPIDAFIDTPKLAGSEFTDFVEFFNVP